MLGNRQLSIATQDLLKKIQKSLEIFSGFLFLRIRNNLR
jgi:hypothetical protein